MRFRERPRSLTLVAGQIALASARLRQRFHGARNAARPAVPQPPKVRKPELSCKKGLPASISAVCQLAHAVYLRLRSPQRFGAVSGTAGAYFEIEGVWQYSLRRLITRPRTTSLTDFVS